MTDIFGRNEKRDGYKPEVETRQLLEELRRAAPSARGYARAQSTVQSTFTEEPPQIVCAYDFTDAFVDVLRRAYPSAYEACKKAGSHYGVLRLLYDNALRVTGYELTVAMLGDKTMKVVLPEHPDRLTAWRPPYRAPNGNDIFVDARCLQAAGADVMVPVACVGRDEKTMSLRMPDGSEAGLGASTAPHATPPPAGEKNQSPGNAWCDVKLDDAPQGGDKPQALDAAARDVARAAKAFGRVKEGYCWLAAHNLHNLIVAELGGKGVKVLESPKDANGLYAFFATVPYAAQQAILLRDELAATVRIAGEKLYEYCTSRSTRVAQIGGPPAVTVCDVGGKTVVRIAYQYVAVQDPIWRAALPLDEATAALLKVCNEPDVNVTEHLATLSRFVHRAVTNCLDGEKIAQLYATPSDTRYRSFYVEVPTDFVTDKAAAEVLDKLVKSAVEGLTASAVGVDGDKKLVRYSAQPTVHLSGPRPGAGTAMPQRRFLSIKYAYEAPAKAHHTQCAEGQPAAGAPATTPAGCGEQTIKAVGEAATCLAMLSAAWNTPDESHHAGKVREALDEVLRRMLADLGRDVYFTKEVPWANEPESVTTAKSAAYRQPGIGALCYDDLCAVVTATVTAVASVMSKRAKHQIVIATPPAWRVENQFDRVTISASCMVG